LSAFKPFPIDTSGIELPRELQDLAKRLANASGNRRAAVETLKTIVKLGYRLAPAAQKEDGDENEPVASSPLRLLEQINSLNLSSLIALWHARAPDEWARVPEIYRRLGQRVLKLGEPLLAYDVLSEGLLSLPADVRMRQLLALALARSGATQRANAILTQLRAEGHQDEETLGILARTHKDLWTQATTQPERRRQLRLAYKFYSEAYRLNRGYYTGINAATLGLLSGRNDEARSLAREVRRSCMKELALLKDGVADRYWPLATLGEAALVQGRWREAGDWYARAVEIARGHFADLSSTRRNARLILDYLGRDVKDIERYFRIPKVVVFAGHLIDRPERPAPRFPPQLESAVRRAIQGRLKGLDAGFGYASAGCGSDILFLETLLESGGEAHVVLPYDKKQFMKDSVGILPGANWGARFQQVLARSDEIVMASNQRIEEGSMSFEYTNLLLHGLAQIKARQLETGLIPLAVWDGQSGDGPGGTASAVERWRTVGLRIELIDLAQILHRECPQLASRNHPSPSVPRRRPRAQRKLETRMMAMLFADAVKFSKLKEQQIPLFLKHFLGAIGKLLSTSNYPPLTKNTWGDGLYFVFADVRAAGQFALELCDLMGDTDWTRKGLPKEINLRIALHAGPVYSCIDPVTGLQSYTGTHVSKAARIEPITPPGQVYASQAFAAMAAAQGVTEFMCDYVGQTPLAKGYGTFATYHVHRGSP
jgi:class 3 adenylate cyclase